MTKQEIFKKAEDLRKETYSQMETLINKEGMCVAVRPTGFGKTGILTRFIVSGEYNNILYVYPSDTVKEAAIRFYEMFAGPIESETDIENVTFISNMKLIRLTDDDIKALGEIDLIIVDEVHTIGAEKTSRAFDYILKANPDAKRIGVTATPDRMDMVDPIARFFNNVMAPAYTLHDAFEDGILQKPYYVFCNYGKMKDNIEYAEKTKEDELQILPSKEEKIKYSRDVDSKLIEISNIYNMENIIKKTCDKYAPQTDYLKFIVFFANFKAIHEHGKEVGKWFSKAYPEHSIDILQVTSETPEYDKNVEVLNDLIPQKKKIDLIFACDKMNLGYHVDDLTGIVMYRGTSSGIIFAQQLGRVLSTGSLNAGIVIDVVDNIHKESIYAVLGKQSVYTKNAKQRKKELEGKLDKYNLYLEYVYGSKDNLPKSLVDEFEKWIALEQKKKQWERFILYKESGETSGCTEYEIEEFEEWIKYPDLAEASRWTIDDDLTFGEWNEGDERELKKLNQRLDNKENIEVFNSTLEPEDLIAVDEEATLRELIVKTVCGPKIMRLNQAITRYMEEGGKCRDERGALFTSRKQFEAQVPPELTPLLPFLRTRHVDPDFAYEYLLDLKPEEFEGMVVEQESRGRERRGEV